MGEALKTIPRKAFYIATKAGHQADCSFDFSPNAVSRLIFHSRERLGVDSIDLLQLYDVKVGDIEKILNETLPAIHDMNQKCPMYSHIGIGSYSLRVLK